MRFEGERKKIKEKTEIKPKSKKILKDIGITNTILIKSDVLWEALKIIKAFVSKNARLYVLQDAFYFNVVDEEIEIIAIDTNNWIKVIFPVQIVSKNGDFCGILNFSKLHQFLDPKILPIQPITIRLGESFVLEVIEFLYLDNQ